MSTYHEIQKIKKQGAALKYAVLSVAAVGILGAVFMAGGKEGYGYGYQSAVQKVQAYLATHHEAVVFVNPNNQAAAIVQNGICKPFPAHVPEGHHTVYVADNWMPCSAVTIAPYIHPVKVMEALK